MSIAIAQSGPEDSGKTTANRLMYENLREKYPEAQVDHLRDNGQDIRAVIAVGGIRIGIESLGDPWKRTTRLVPGLALFVRLECDLIVCATRTRGLTVDVVSRLEIDGYEIKWRHRTRETGPAAQEKRNRTEAQWMVRHIESEFAATAV